MTVGRYNLYGVYFYMNFDGMIDVADLRLFNGFGLYK